MCEVAQKLMNTPLFCFQDLKLSTIDIITVLEDNMNTTSSPLPIPDPHATWAPSNTLEKHSIGSCVVNGVSNLVTSSSMAKLLGFPTYDLHSHIRRELKSLTYGFVIQQRRCGKPLFPQNLSLISEGGA